ncbi:ATP synthase subunit C [Candidatus Venteria ishoeyi]|uniref:ATP synthase subunit C n=1 Tax=Candidatus Venteria ishoeyi TaxID=1899563 RepID=UPI0025A556D0|nr:ATP synthase subunit C [Candidatus Venteria ishoeyi]MDM8546649.1 ATP synthase subunit C [Candidatus Venteria ishoeyi]
MLWISGLMGFTVLLIIASGFYLHSAEQAEGVASKFQKQWLKHILGFNALLFIGSFLALTLLATQQVFAEPVAIAASKPMEMTMGAGLVFLGIALPTIFAVLAAAYAVAAIGTAALAVIAEKPETFGRSLIFMGLAEGIAIYGLVLSILMLDKI